MNKRFSVIAIIMLTVVSYGQNANPADTSQLENIIEESFDEIWSKLISKNI